MAILLPHHVVEEILSRLPTKTLLRFRCVCKAWLATISDFSFIKLQLSQSIDQDATKFNVWNAGLIYDLDIISSNKALITNPVPAGAKDFSFFLGSCDGLIFFISKNWKKLSVMNPSTRARKVVVEFEESIEAESMFIYRDLISSDYKLLRFNYITRFSSEVTTYSFSKKTWKKVRNVPYHICGGGEFLFRGVKHWVADSKVRRVILAFRLDIDSFSEITLFDEDPNLSCKGELTEWENKLCFIHAPKVKTIEVIAVWVMREYGNKDSWTKLFVIDNLINIRTFTIHLLHMKVHGMMALDICYDQGEEDKDSSLGMFVCDEKNRSLKEIIRKNNRTGKNKLVCDPRRLFSHIDSLLDPQQLLKADQGKNEVK